MDERVKKIAKKVKIVDIICFTVPGILAVLGLFVDPATAIVGAIVFYNLSINIIRKEYKKSAVNNCLYKEHDPRLAEAVERAIYPKWEETDEEKARYDYLAGDYAQAEEYLKRSQKKTEWLCDLMFEQGKYDVFETLTNNDKVKKHIAEYESGQKPTASLLLYPYLFCYAFSAGKYGTAEQIVSFEIEHSKPEKNVKLMFEDLYRKYRRGVTEYMLGKYDEAKADLAPMAACPKLGASKSAQYYLDKMEKGEVQS